MRQYQNYVDSRIEMPAEVRAFVDATIKRANKYERRVVLLNDEFVMADGLRCGGYYESDLSDRHLIAACGKPLDVWLGTLVHESCHMDQDIERSDVWLAGEDSDGDVLYQEWLAGHCELTPEYLKQWTQQVQGLELDCEMRTAKRITEYNLPLNLDEYVRAANSYVYFYTMSAKRRSWYVTPPYASAIVASMPTSFLPLEEYWNISPELEALYDEYCFKEKT